MGNAFLLIIVGLLLFYVVISDKFYCFEGCAACLAGKLESNPTVLRDGVGNSTGTIGTAGGSIGISVPNVSQYFQR